MNHAELLSNAFKKLTSYEERRKAEMNSETQYSIGEVIDKIEQGYYAISIHDNDKETIISVDENNDVFFIFPDCDFKTKSSCFEKSTGDSLKRERYLIKYVDSGVQEYFDSLQYKHSVDIWLDENWDNLRELFYKEFISEIKGENK